MKIGSSLEITLSTAKKARPFFKKVPYFEIFLSGILLPFILMSIENVFTPDKTDAYLYISLVLQVALECVDLLNEIHRVKTLLKTIDTSAGDPLVLRSLCQMCHHLLVSDKAAAHKYRILNMLALKPAFLRDVWSATLAAAQTSLFGEATPLLNVIARGCPTTPEDSAKIVPLLAVFCSLFTLLIITLHDAEFYPDSSVPGTVIFYFGSQGAQRYCET